MRELSGKAESMNDSSQIIGPTDQKCYKGVYLYPKAFKICCIFRA